jgi:hypothetical protein
MRSMKGAIYGYARKQARREVYKAYNSYKKNTYTNNKNAKVECSDSDFVVGLITLFCIMIFIGWLMGG